jgi:DNA-binding response OmpR family regulator
MKVLVIEDEKELRLSILKFLRQEGYICESAETYKEAAEKINVYNYECLIVDINLPGGTGIDLIREFKQKDLEAGIIIISARNSLEDKLTGLDIGADDYLTKPFHLQELNARIRSVIRRRSFKGNNEIIFNEIKVLPDKREVYVLENALVLTTKEYDMLLFFLMNKGRVLSKDAMAEHLYGDHMDQADSFDFLYSHIKNLRKKLVMAGAKDYITSVYGIGYKFLSS